MTHDLKTWPRFFEDVRDGRKAFELRRDDLRGFEAGDILHLREWDPVRKEYTGRSVDRLVTFVLCPEDVADGGLAPGFVIMSLSARTAREDGRGE